jgi:hypothetical protein
MKKEVEVEVVDHSLRDGVVEHRFASDQHGGLTDETRADNLPEDIVGKLAKHLGDAQAQVTVGADLTTSVDFGNKAGAFVSVKVTCNNSEADISAALDIARELAEQKVAENHTRMSELLDEARGMVSEKPSRGPTVARTVATGPRKIDVPKTSGGKTFPTVRR